jgi:hypothetical protein
MLLKQLECQMKGLYRVFVDGTAVKPDNSQKIAFKIARLSIYCFVTAHNRLAGLSSLEATD